MIRRRRIFKKKHLIAIAILFAANTAAAIPLPEDLSFHFVIPSPRSHFRLDREGPLRVEFRDVPFAEMRDLLRTCRKRGLLPSFSSHPPTLYIYLPMQPLLMQQKQRVRHLAIEQFQEIYPGVELNVKFRVIRKSLIDLERVSENFKKIIKSFGRAFPDDPKAAEYAAAMLKANEEALREAQAFDREENDQYFGVTAVRRIKYGFASARFLILSATRLAQSWVALHAGGPPAAAGLALVVSDPVIEYYTIIYARKIQRFFSRSPIPAVNNFLDVKMSHFMNATVWNLFSYGLLRPLTMQSLGHLSNPAIRAPTATDAAGLFALNSIGAGLYSGFATGSETLRQKGWLSGSQIDLILQVSGLFDLATGIFSSNPAWYIYRWFTWGPQWTFYGLVHILARILPARMDKLVAVETSINNWDDVLEEQIADASWIVHNRNDLDELVKVLQGSRPLGEILPPSCSDLFEG